MGWEVYSGEAMPVLVGMDELDEHAARNELLQALDDATEESARDRLHTIGATVQEHGDYVVVNGEEYDCLSLAAEHLCND